MGKYRFKPVDTEAVQFDGTNWVELAVFCGTRTVDGDTMPIFTSIGTFLISLLASSKPLARAELYVKENDGHVRVAPGEWIVKRGEGDFWLCEDKVFRKLFEQTGE